MNEDRARLWDVGLKLTAIVGSVFLFFYGFAEYERSRRDESSVEFWKQQFPIYQELCRVAAAIPTVDDEEKLIRLREEFWTLYYGHARMVVDASVHEKLSAYAYQLKLKDIKMSSAAELQLAAYELATACRKSMAESWSVSLSELQSEPIK